MSTYTMKLDPEPYSKIRRGQKTIELRLYDEKRQKLEVGDVIIFTNKDNEKSIIKTVVTALHVFPSFEELYKNIPLEKCGYTEENIHLASHNDMNAYYSQEEQEKYGALGIEIRREISVIGDALSELAAIEKNEDNAPEWEQYLKTDVWEEKFFGKNG